MNGSAPHMAREYLKVDLHTHSADDPVEHIQYTSCELIDRAHLLGFDAISITNHNALLFSEYLRDYARERGIVLIPGAEISVQGKHVVILNADERIVQARSFKDLRRLRTPAHMIVAPHPYFPAFSSLLGQLGKNIDVFDAIEFSWFYHSAINFNLFAVKTAARHGLPLLCTSDCHHFEKIGSAYSLVDAEKNAEAIIEAVKAGRVEMAANPLKLTELGKHGVELVAMNAMGILRGLFAGGD
jgi:predicted metal-dependent phosphoesterase TrpH